MKKILVLALLALLTTPAMAKQTCQTTSAKGITHYRLIDGKQCWYKGAHVAKSELEWKHGTSLARPGRSSGPSLAIDTSRGRPTGSVGPSSPDYISSLNTGVTPDDLAISVMCGGETSGFCMSFEGRWKNASP